MLAGAAKGKGNADGNANANAAKGKGKANGAGAAGAANNGTAAAGKFFFLQPLWSTDLVKVELLAPQRARVLLPTARVLAQLVLVTLTEMLMVNKLAPRVLEKVRVLERVRALLANKEPELAQAPVITPSNCSKSFN